jgi:DNA adenine methylase
MAQRTLLLEPIIKWPGGKQGELSLILPRLPSSMNTYFEPFLGGGAVYFNIPSSIPAFVNDRSTDLIDFYQCIAQDDPAFFSTLERIDVSWEGLSRFISDNAPCLVNLYMQYRDEVSSSSELGAKISDIVLSSKEYFQTLFTAKFSYNLEFFLKESINAIRDKIIRMKKLEMQKGQLPTIDIQNNLESALKSAFYYYVRHLYNYSTRYTLPLTEHSAFFYFLRENAYAAMFRFNRAGQFNVPYGGISYNRKRLQTKIEKIRANGLHKRLHNTKFANLDFLEFLRKHPPQVGDFVFFDPPYDTEFSAYDQNSFGRSDQERLAEYVINECKANVMLVLKSTEFILSLYSKNNLNLQSFDKTYMYTIKERNIRDVTHVMITNYPTIERLPLFD